jgi:hypothetical protein
VCAGGIVVFSSLTLHATGPNPTGETRRAYIIQCQYAPDGAIAPAARSEQGAITRETCAPRPSGSIRMLRRTAASVDDAADVEVDAVDCVAPSFASPALRRGALSDRGVLQSGAPEPHGLALAWARRPPRLRRVPRLPERRGRVSDARFACAEVSDPDARAQGHRAALLDHGQERLAMRHVVEPGVEAAAQEVRVRRADRDHVGARARGDGRGQGVGGSGPDPLDRRVRLERRTVSTRARRVRSSCAQLVGRSARKRRTQPSLVAEMKAAPAPGATRSSTPCARASHR